MTSINDSLETGLQQFYASLLIGWRKSAEIMGDTELVDAINLAIERVNTLA